MCRSAHSCQTVTSSVHPRPSTISSSSTFRPMSELSRAQDGEITLYDTGWKQLEYIFDWNTSCCWWDLREQMRNIGLDPGAVTRIVIGHGHWDHSGQLNSFPKAVLYVQKEELRAIDFFTSYPTEFNSGHIRAVNTVDPITGAQVGPPRRPARGVRCVATRRRHLLKSKARSWEEGEDCRRGV